MDTHLILKNFDNGTITKDATIDLLLQHTPRAYAIGAYLEARIQRDTYRDQLYALQDTGTQKQAKLSLDLGPILTQLGTGKITKDAAITLLAADNTAEHLAFLYLCAREQRESLRDDLFSLQDEKPRTIMDGHVITDLIDHALDTDHISIAQAENLLIKTGMDTETANHHIDTILTITDRDLERVQYLDDPETAPRYCTRCGRKVTAHELSRRGICVECSTAAVEECLIALDTKTGPVYRRWRDAMLSFAYKLEDQAIKERPKLYAGTLGDYIDQDKAPSCLGDGCNDETCQWYQECIEPDPDMSGEPD